jgi:hypothetical protein
MCTEEEVARQHHIGPPYRVSRCPHRLHPLLVTHITLVEIVAKVHRPAQTIISPTNDTTTTY